MQNWEVMAAAIPRAHAERVAQLLHYSPDQIRRWRREPLEGESVRANGFYSPLDRICDAHDAIYVTYRPGASLLVNRLNAHHHRVAYPNSLILSLDGLPDQRNRAGAQLLQAAAGAVESLTEAGITRETVFRLIQLKDKADEILACANQDLLRAEEITHA